MMRKFDRATRGLPLPRLAVVFDTNLYRSIGPAAYETMRGHEEHHSVIAYAHYLVVTELLAHLADEADPDFYPCVAALQRLGRHCSSYDGSSIALRFMQLPDTQVPRALFDGARPPEEAQVGAYSTIIGLLLSGAIPQDLRPHFTQLSALRDQVQRSEEEFVDGLWRRVVLTLEPNAASWQAVVKSPKRLPLLAALDAGQGLDLVAATIVDRAAARSRVTLTPESRTQAIGRARALFPTAVHHHDLLIRELVRNGPDMARPDRANSVWDHEITFCTAPGAVVHGVPLVLVTADPLILRAADAAQSRGHIWSFTDYNERLVDRREYIDHWLVHHAP